MTTPLWDLVWWGSCRCLVFATGSHHLTLQVFPLQSSTFFYPLPTFFHINHKRVSHFNPLGIWLSIKSLCTYHFAYIAVLPSPAASCVSVICAPWSTYAICAVIILWVVYFLSYVLQDLFISSRPWIKLGLGALPNAHVCVLIVSAPPPWYPLANLRQRE